MKVNAAYYVFFCCLESLPDANVCPQTRKTASLAHRNPNEIGLAYLAFFACRVGNNFMYLQFKFGVVHFLIPFFTGYRGQHIQAGPYGRRKMTANLGFHHIEEPSATQICCAALC